jgi:hypothetical protein
VLYLILIFNVTFFKVNPYTGSHLKIRKMSIDLYVKQLQEDIRLAAQNTLVENGDIADDSTSFEKQMEEVESFVYGTMSPLSKIVGIATVQLPPPEKLSDAQQATLYEDMESLLNAFNFYPDFPQKLPGHLKYQIMRSRWDTEHVHMSCGESHLEFCEYEPKECPFPAKFCSCKNY